MFRKSQTNRAVLHGSIATRTVQGAVIALVLLGTPWVGRDSSAQGQIRSNATIVGAIDVLQIDNPADPYSGGRIVVAGQTVIIPRNLVLEMPANFLPLGEFFAQAPPDCVARGQSGVAAEDTCEGAAVGVATMLANLTLAGDLIAGNIFIEKGQETASGVVSFINYDEGYFRINGTVGSDTTGLMIRLNDPDTTHTIQLGTGCRPGSINCSADVRFTNDPENYTFVYTTGYPACIPSTVGPSPVVGGLRTTGSDAFGVGDAFCPQGNRDFTLPVPDSSRFAPLRVGDPIGADGNFEVINGVRFLSAHTIAVLVGLDTAIGDPTQPDYIIFDEAFIDVGGFQNERARALFIGFATAADDVIGGGVGAQLDIFGLHADPATNAMHEVPLGSTVNNPNVVNQGIGAGAAGIFKIRYDVDFILGAPVLPLNSPCTNLRNAGFTSACSVFATMAEEFSILSPFPREIIGRTRQKTANPTLETFDITGTSTRWGEYLTPISPEFPEFVEINLNLIAQPFIFAGVPYNLDRRLHPAGCVDTNGDGIVDCEATPQPLDPFPYSGLDPRTQAGNPGVPFSARDRIISHWGPDPVTGIPGPGNVLMAWPPPDPPSLAATLGTLTPRIRRATYKETSTGTGIDVWVTDSSGAPLSVSGVGVPVTPMNFDGTDKYFVHIDLPVGTPTPASITVTNTALARPASRALIDEVFINSSTFAFDSGTLNVQASSSSAAASAALELCTGEPLGPTGNLNLVVGPVPPQNVCVTSPLIGGKLSLPVTVQGCDDGNACTIDTPTAGGCVHDPVNCDDGDACTADTCDPLIGCQHAVVDCSDANVCTADTCDTVLGCVNVPTTVPCDDGNPCTIGDLCSAGTCAPGVPDNAVCNDGDLCNGLETCDVLLGCLPGTPLVCNDGDQCTVDSCNAAVGCVVTPTVCDDGDVCNGVETCDSLVGCVAGTPLTCNDGLPCNGVETCDPVTGCQPGTPPPACCVSNLDCDNGNACDGIETCVANSCVPGVPINCDDGLFCNGTEICVGGVCQPGSGVCVDACEQCNETLATCEWCVMDHNQNGSIDGVDFAFFSGCFGACYLAGDPCLAANYDGDLGGCVGGPEFGAITGCFSLNCANCPNCHPVGGGPSPLLPGGRSSRSLEVAVRPVVVRTPTGGDVSDTLPGSIETVTSGESFYVEIWASRMNVLGGKADGLAAVYIDLDVDSATLDIEQTLSTDLFATFSGGAIEPGGTIRSLGGCAPLGVSGMGISPAWARVAMVRVRATDVGTGSLILRPSGRPYGVSLFGRSEGLSASGIAFGTADVRIVSGAPSNGTGR